MSPACRQGRDGGRHGGIGGSGRAAHHRTIARSLAQGKQIEKRVALTILALARLAHIVSPDGGTTFLLRRPS